MVVDCLSASSLENSKGNRQGDQLFLLQLPEASGSPLLISHRGKTELLFIVLKFFIIQS